MANVIITSFALKLILALGSGDYGAKDVGSGRIFVGCGIITFFTALYILFIFKETKGLSEH